MNHEKTDKMAGELMRGEYTAADMLHAVALEWSNAWLSIEAFAGGHGLTWHEAAALTELARIVAKRRGGENAY